MRRIGNFGWVAVISCLACMVPQEVKAERSMSRTRLEKELNHLRGSLHEAHRELGIKAERIADLEAALEKLSGNKGKTVSSEARQQGEASKKKGGASKKKQEAVVPPPAEANGAEKKASVSGNEPPLRKAAAKVVEQIFYERNSAVNYEGREKILRFVQEELERSPEARFSVVATANDSAFEKTDQDIASNRARFLVSYLKIRGIPEEAFSSVEGKPAGKSGRKGRVARVTAVREP